MISEKRCQVVWNTMMSLDGFVADPHEAMDWTRDIDTGPGDLVGAMVDRLGALLVGRRTMDVEDRHQPGFYGGAYGGPFFVVTSDRARPTPLVKGVEGQLVHGPIEQAVATARSAADGKDVGVLGGTLAASCLDAGLVDEVVVFVAPVMLGGGVRLYEGRQRRLDLVGSEQFGDVLLMRYAAVRG